MLAKALRFPLLALLAIIMAPKAHGAACCTSATAFGTGRLLLWESWAAGLRTNFSHEIGFFDQNGVFGSHENDTVDQHIRLEAYTLVATSENGAVFVVLPWLFPRLGTSDNIEVGSNLSDLQIGYRHQVIAIGEYEELPSLALTASVLFPTGNPRDKGVKAHEVTSRDALALIAGVSLEKTWMPLFAQLNLGGSLLFNHFRTQNQVSERISPTFEASLAAGVEVMQDVVTAAFGSWTYEHLGKWKSSAGLSASWRINPHFTLQASASSDVLINGLGSGRPGAFSYGFGIRYGYF